MDLWGIMITVLKLYLVLMGFIIVHTGYQAIINMRESRRIRRREYLYFRQFSARRETDESLRRMAEKVRRDDSGLP